MGTVQFKRRPLDDWEILAVENACENLKETLVVYTLMDTGMRVSEFLNLSIQDIYPQRGYAVILGNKGKRNKQIPLTPRVIGVLGQWLSGRTKIGYSASWWNRILRRLGERAGIDRRLHPHILRHTFAVQSLRSGVDIESVRRVMGHSSLAITEQYLNYTESDVLRAFWKARDVKDPTPEEVEELENRRKRLEEFYDRVIDEPEIFGDEEDEGESDDEDDDEGEGEFEEEEE